MSSRIGVSFFEAAAPETVRNSMRF